MRNRVIFDFEDYILVVGGGKVGEEGGEDVGGRVRCCLGCRGELDIVFFSRSFEFVGKLDIRVLVFREKGYIRKLCLFLGRC